LLGLPAIRLAPGTGWQSSRLTIATVAGYGAEVTSETPSRNWRRSNGKEESNMTKQSEVGDFREFAGITFAAVEYLKTFDGRLRGVIWRATPVGIASRVDESWKDTTGHRFAANAVH
jgi:hypothetical protein